MSGDGAPDPVAAGAVDGAEPDLSRAAGIGQANTQKQTGAQVPLPYFVQVGDDPRACMVEPDMLGGFKASNWQGAIGTFPTAVEAERALLAAPKAPRQPRPEPKKKARPKPLPSRYLTGAPADAVIRDQDGRFIVCGHRKIGAFDTWAAAYTAANSGIIREEAP